MKYVWIIATCVSMILALLTFALFPQSGGLLPLAVLTVTYPCVMSLLEPPSSHVRRRVYDGGPRRPPRVRWRVEIARPSLAPADREPSWQPAIVLEPAPRVELFCPEQLTPLARELVWLDGWARGHGSLPEVAAALRGAMPPDEACRALASIGQMLVTPQDSDAATWALERLWTRVQRRGVLPVDVSRIGQAFGDSDVALARFAATYGYTPRSTILLDVRHLRA